MRPFRAIASAAVLAGGLSGTTAVGEPAQLPGSAAPQAGGATVWIFSGQLKDSREAFSGTLVTAQDGADFELKMGGGATCDASLAPSAGELVRLPEITCSDDRTMRALFAPDADGAMRVFGNVGSERFLVEAHLLGTGLQSTSPPGPSR